MKSVALILAKGKSQRLPGKNKLDFNGKPMWQWNTLKCLKLFDEVYVSSDDDEVLQQALKMGAIPIRRGEILCGDTPNITVYRHAVSLMRGVHIIIAVQANSPTISEKLIKWTKVLMERGAEEVMTCHEDYTIYGSIWALTFKRLKDYQDPYNPKPEVLLFDPSTDIHTQDDLNKSLHE